MAGKKKTSKKVATRSKKRASPKAAQPASHFMTVIPDDFADVDRIGYSDHGEGLVEMIRTVQSRGSFTIGIYGQWGKGKTSMLRQIKRALDTEDPGTSSGMITVWFNPWRYTGEKHLILPFFHTLVAAFETYKDKDTGFWKKHRPKVREFWEKLKRVPIALAYGLEGEIKVPLFLKAKFNFQRFIDEGRRGEAKVDRKIEEEKASVSRKLIEEHESLYYNLIEELERAAEALDVKVVVFIDDLDRCLPEKAVELLEGLKVLLDLENFIFVIGVAREVVERGIRVRYKELFEGDGADGVLLERDYLEKIVQFPFVLPPAAEDRLREHVEELMKDLDRAHPYLDTIIESVGPTPRNLKRYINAVAFTMWVAEKKKGSFKEELLIKMSLIAFLIPDLYQQLGAYPHDLIRIQQWIDDQSKQDPIEGSGSKEKARSQKEKAELPKKTEIKAIDRWLEHPYLPTMRAILEKKQRMIKGENESDKGFADEDEVKCYVGMLAPALESKVEPKTRIAPFLHGEKGSLQEEMRNRLVPIEGGKFQMGDEEEGTIEVEVSPFMMDRYPVTQSLYQRVMGTNPSHFKGDERPVENVSWHDAVKFCNRLSAMTDRKACYLIEDDKVSLVEDANGFRLPTEAEWEYACRAGTETAFWFGDEEGDLQKYAWYVKNSDGGTHPVGRKPANPWGLHDMHGNVWEWVWDWYGKYPKEIKEAIKDYKGPEGGSEVRILRGGSWFDLAWGCRSAYRIGDVPGVRYGDLGFRPVNACPER